MKMYINFCISKLDVTSSCHFYTQDSEKNCTVHFSSMPVLIHCYLLVLLTMNQRRLMQVNESKSWVAIILRDTYMIWCYEL